MAPAMAPTDSKLSASDRQVRYAPPVVENDIPFSTLRSRRTTRRSSWGMSRGESSTPCTTARTVSGKLRNDYILLYHSFFYDIDSVWRAATVVHEVRHARDRRLHLGSACGRRFSCDRKWSDAGSNTYEMLWLAAYFHSGQETSYISDVRKARAEAVFETLRLTGFDQQVRWNKASFSQINDLPEWYLDEVACSEGSPTHRCLMLAN